MTYAEQKARPVGTYWKITDRAYEWLAVKNAQNFFYIYILELIFHIQVILVYLENNRYGKRLLILKIRDI